MVTRRVLVNLGGNLEKQQYLLRSAIATKLNSTKQSSKTREPEAAENLK